VREAHPLAIAVSLVEAVLSAVLVGLSVVAEDLAGVEEQAVTSKVSGRSLIR
jgi:hypothetical protein